MNSFGRFLAVISLLLVYSAQIQARGNSVYEETYHIGYLTGNINGGAEYGEVQAEGFVLSARNKKAVLEYVNLTSDSGTILGNADTWESNISGLYLSLIGQGQPYMKFKVGNIKHEYIQATGGTPAVEVNSVTSYGLGFGYKVGSRIMLEFDITTLDREMTLMALTILF